MLFLILAIVVTLVAWALRLMDQALKVQEFSLMLAGFLVASSAAALVGGYFLMSNYMVYINESTPGSLTLQGFDPGMQSFADSTQVTPTWLVTQD